MTLKKLKLLKTSLFLLFSIFIATNTFSQVVTTGKEFYVTFGRDWTASTVAFTNQASQKDTIQFVLRVTAATNADVTLNFAGNAALDTTFSVGAGQIKDYFLTFKQAQAVYFGGAYNATNHAANMKSIYVTSSTPINLVAFTFAGSNMTEATLVSPIGNLGTNYYYVGQSIYGQNGTNYDGFLIIAAKDNTKIDFTGGPSIASVTLSKGEVYQYLGTGSSYPMGTKITASDSVAVFQNTTQGYITAAQSSGAPRWNYMYEQLAPVEHWGTRFIMPTNNLGAAWVRVFANKYPTVVVISYSNNRKVTQTLTSGTRFFDIKIDADNNNKERAAYINSDNPISASIYHTPYNNTTGQMSQPGTAWLPPLGQRIKSALISPLDVSHGKLAMPFDHYMQIITPTATKNNTTISINGGPAQPVPNNVWITDNIGGSGYSFGLYYFGQSQVIPPPKFLNITALIENPDGVILLAYGQGNYANYYYSAGAGVRDLTQIYTISGTVSGLPNNANIAVEYTINGGVQKSVMTDDGGNYTIPDVPAAASVIIIPSEQPGYTGSVTPLPNTSLVTSNLTGKNILYKENTAMRVEYAKVFSCHENTEIDILAMLGYDCARDQVVFNMIEQPQYADPILALDSNLNLPYIRTINFEGRDNLQFTVACGAGAPDTVLLQVFTIACPDNIVDPSCAEPPRSETLDIRLRSKTRIGDGDKYSDYIAEMDMPLVGDIYGDGNVKILAAVSRDRDPGAERAWLSQGIAIFDGKTGAWEDTISVVPFHLGSGTRAIGKVNGVTKIFIASGGGGLGFEDTDNRVVCYDLKTGNRDWISSETYVPVPDQIAATVFVADMNGDGTPEVIAGNKIYNAATGVMLLDMSTMSGLTYGTGAGFKYYSTLCDHMPYFPAVADMSNDGNLNFVAGPNIYNIYIPMNAQDASGSTISSHRFAKPAPPSASLPAGGTLDNVSDGATAVADLDGDGYLDVIVTRYAGGAGEPGYPFLYAYSGKTGEMFGNAINIWQKFIGGTTDPTYGQGPSVPVIGDIDGCGKPEIVVSTNLGITAFEYDPDAKALKEIAFYKPQNDSTGMAAMAMFDFNQDGTAELMFHDTDRGRILSYDSINATFVDLLAGSDQLGGCYSNTQNEYTVVADVTGDARANIVIFGSDHDETSMDDLGKKGYVYIYEGTPEQPWAPARKVWNQWAYNAVNINNDLTVPKYQANPAIMYIEADGNRIRPYNAFLQQQSLINSDGRYVWTLPKLAWVGDPVLTIDGDSIVVSGKITNPGDVGLMAPVYVTIYKDSIKGDIIKLDSINQPVNPNEIINFSVTVKNIDNFSPIANIIVRLNDEEGDFPYQQVCVPSDDKSLRFTSFTVNGVDYIEADGKAWCSVVDFVFQAVPATLKPDSWKLNGNTIAGSEGQSVVYQENLPEGYYTVEMIFNGQPYTTHFFVGPAPIIWTPENNTAGTDADKQNWDIPDNWTPAEIPNSCNNVFIPGNSTNYPMLTSPAACNKIYFIQGSELGRPDMLNYKKAYVHYNFGLSQTGQIADRSQDSLVLKSSSTTDRMYFSAAVSADALSRERWYMMASPLQGILAGDLSFGGFPLTFLMKFGIVDKATNYRVGSWTVPYNDMTEPTATDVTDGFAYYMYGYGDNYLNKPANAGNDGCLELGSYNDPLYNDLTYLPKTRTGFNYGLEGTNGIIELPFFSDSTQLYSRRTQVYDSASNKSTFYYVYDGSNGSTLNVLSGKEDAAAREADDGNYRFAPEDYLNGKWSFRQTIAHPGTGLGSGDDFLVGNPYMSSIDIITFLTDNANTLLPQFKIWNGATFLSYQVDLDSKTITLLEPPAEGSTFDPRYIAPLQGFFLKTKSAYDGTGDAATFDVTRISTVRPTGVLSNFRSAQQTKEENVLRIKAENKFIASYALIGFKDKASVGFDAEKDVQKLFSPYAYVPEVYSLAGELPTDINFIPGVGTIIVPLGIKTGRTEEIHLTFTGMDNYGKASKIEFIDALENLTVDLTGKSSYTYTFTPKETGVINGRFALRISHSPTALTEVADPDNLYVYGDSEGFYVVSSASDPVQQVIVYDFQGKKVYESASGETYYPLPENLDRSPLIVKVITQHGAKTVKLTGLKQ